MMGGRKKQAVPQAYYDPTQGVWVALAPPKKRRRWGLFVVPLVFFALIGGLACLLSLLPAMVPAVAPWLSRQYFGSPQSIWDFYVNLYNTEYQAEQPAEEFVAVLEAPFVPGTSASAHLEEWAVMRAEEGAIVTQTLTLGGVDLNEGQVKLLLDSGARRCFYVWFKPTDAGYLIRGLKPCAEVHP